MSEKKINIYKRKIMVTASFFIIIAGLLFMNSSYVSAKNISLLKPAMNSAP